jgi:hypothetical protein
VESGVDRDETKQQQMRVEVRVLVPSTNHESGKAQTILFAQIIDRPYVYCSARRSFGASEPPGRRRHPIVEPPALLRERVTPDRSKAKLEENTKAKPEENLRGSDNLLSSPLDVGVLSLQASKNSRKWGEVAQALLSPQPSQRPSVKRPALKD